MKPRIVHFEFAADDPERATTFYSGLFGWSINKWDGPMEYWLIETGEEGDGSVGGAIMRRESAPADVINTVAVDDIDAYLAKVTVLGGELAGDKMAIPGVGWHAYCRDTEGILFGILESDPAAE